MRRTDLLVVGAGPAGMSAAIAARRFGMDVMVVDEQPAPGGQIWRSIETAKARDLILGPSFTEGRAVAETFRASDVTYLPLARLWQLEPGFRAFLSQDGKSQIVEASSVILATGAQERPVPFPGWTLPGVLTIGAAQILLKSAGEIPASPVWLAGTGPLLLLYAVQLIEAGGTIAGILDTSVPGQWKSAARHLPRALRSAEDLLKGLAWMRRLQRSNIEIIRGVSRIEALGDQRLERLRFSTDRGASRSVPADVLLVHEGVVPSLHGALSVDCVVEWNNAQDCFVPTLDQWGETTVSNLFVAGDGAGIGGAKAALTRGELATLRIASKLGCCDKGTLHSEERGLRRRLARELSARPLLDALYRPRAAVFSPMDETIICRCEEVSAGVIRQCAMVGQPGPNQIKSATRAGMGPCQGRQCGYTVTRLIADAQGRHPADVGYLHIRSPLKPVTLGELASLETEDVH